MLKAMPRGKDSDTVMAVLPKSLKNKLRQYAKKHRWSLSQTVLYFIETGLEREDTDSES